MNNFFQRPTGKEKLTPRGWYNKWHAYLYGDALAKQGVKYKNVFLDDFEKMKKKSKIKKILNRKTDRNPIDVSTMQGDEKPQSDNSNLIQIGAQVGMPEEKKKKRTKPLTGMDLVKKRISFADFRKQSSELHKEYGRDSI